MEVVFVRTRWANMRKTVLLDNVTYSICAQSEREREGVGFSDAKRIALKILECERLNSSENALETEYYGKVGTG